MVAAEQLIELAKEAKLTAKEFSAERNPTWGDAEFAEYREYGAQLTPVLECRGNLKDNPKMMAKAHVGLDDVQHLWAMCTHPNQENPLIAQKSFAPGEKKEMEFEIPANTMFIILYMKSLTKGVWMSNPYIQLSWPPAHEEYFWDPFLSHEKGACHTAPEEADQWYPQCDRHPELLWESKRRVVIKVLYLHGHANNEEIARRQVDALQTYLPCAPDIHILKGNVKLTEKKHFASVIDYSPQLVELGLSGTAGYDLEGYGHIESPAEDPDNDPTCQTNCEGVKWAKMSKESMAYAVSKVKEKFLENDGYHAVIGFSQGGEVIQNFLNELPELNKRVTNKCKMFGLFGTRTYYKKYGPLTAKFNPYEMKAFIAMGVNDDEDTKDATRKTDNLWDLQEFAKLYSDHGCHVHTATHQGGHEFPSTKVEGMRAFWARFWDFYHTGPRGEGAIPPILPRTTKEKPPPGIQKYIDNGGVNEIHTVGTWRK